MERVIMAKFVNDDTDEICQLKQQLKKLKDYNKVLNDEINKMKSSYEFLKQENDLYKKYILTDYEIEKANLTHSTILECVIKSGDNIISSNKTKYIQVLLDIWKSMNPQTKIISNTGFNIKFSKENEKGYRWNEELQFSFQSKDATSTFREIITMVKLNNYNIYICIELKNKQVIFYK